jgi:hypothetical protein
MVLCALRIDVCSWCSFGGECQVWGRPEQRGVALVQGLATRVLAHEEGAKDVCAVGGASQKTMT